MVQSFYLLDDSDVRISSRDGASIRLDPSGGEAVLQASSALRSNILKVAEAIIQRDRMMQDLATGAPLLPLMELGAKGAGEAGTAGAPGAVVNAINDALRPLKAQCWSQPVTPEKILRALGHI